jgi:hypothetical protein
MSTVTASRSAIFPPLVPETGLNVTVSSLVSSCLSCHISARASLTAKYQVQCTAAIELRLCENEKRDHVRQARYCALLRRWVGRMGGRWGDIFSEKDAFCRGGTDGAAVS